MNISVPMASAVELKYLSNHYYQNVIQNIFVTYMLNELIRVMAGVGVIRTWLNFRLSGPQTSSGCEPLICRRERLRCWTQKWCGQKLARKPVIRKPGVLTTNWTGHKDNTTNIFVSTSSGNEWELFGLESNPWKKLMRGTAANVLDINQNINENKK